MNGTTIRLIDVAVMLAKWVEFFMKLMLDISLR